MLEVLTGVTWDKLGLCTVQPEIGLNHRENYNLYLLLFSKLNYHPVILSIEQEHECTASGSNTVGLTPGYGLHEILSKIISYLISWHTWTLKALIRAWPLPVGNLRNLVQTWKIWFHLLALGHLQGIEGKREIYLSQMRSLCALLPLHHSLGGLCCGLQKSPLLCDGMEEVIRQRINGRTCAWP